MTSIFDQFEQSLQKGSNNAVSAVDISSSGYIHMKMEEDGPIFKKSKRDFTPADKITHVAISNKYLVIVMANSVIFRMDMHQPELQDEISFSKYTNTNRLTNIFLDPTGNHLLLSLPAKSPEGSPELLYINRKSNKIRATIKFRGHEITEVGWNHEVESDTSTGPILLGTSKGLILETEIAVEGDKFFTSGFSSGIEQYWKQVFDIGKGINTPIRGLEFFKIPQKDQYCIFVATANRLYFFKGAAKNYEKPLLQQIFNLYLNINEKETFIETEFKSIKSKLKFWSENLIVPDKLIWMTENEILYSEIDLNTVKNINDIIVNSTKLKFPKVQYEIGDKRPFSVLLTEFHVLLGYNDSIKAISCLNNELVYEDNYNEAFGRLINVTRDVKTGTIWSISENALFKICVNKENRNVWHIFADKKEFELAKKYARDNEINYNQVLMKEATDLFNKGEYELSALRFAETQNSFEEICLKFIQIEKVDALKLFLTKKLDNLKAKDKTQITMIVLWVTELFLNELERIKLKNGENDIQFKNLQREFEMFLTQTKVSDCIKDNKATIYKLMASHGDKTNLIKFTIVNKDFERLIRQHIYKNNFHEALEVLKSQNNRDLFYQFTPLLIKETPKLMVKALIDQNSNLNAVKLLPAFVSCTEEFMCLEVVKYLEFCVETLKNTEKAVHNLLLSLYAKYDPQKLMNYLNSQGQDIVMVNYDVHFALRLCRERKMTEACVQLSALLGLWESAVDLALKVKVDLAKQIASLSPQGDVELRKKLWLKIAEHVISGKDDIKTAMDFLKQCDLIKIEDILPFFSDFVTIDHFKEPICTSLKEYNQHIQDLKDEMEEATKSAELVRKEIQSFRNRYTFVSSCDSCDICDLVLMVRPFYIFPCQHRFHSDCLLKELSPMLGQAKKNKLADLHRQLNILNNQSSDNISTGSTGISMKDNIKTEIDNVIASECLYCGENMIRNIDTPFIDENDYDRVMKEWE